MIATDELTLVGGFPGEQLDNKNAINVFGYSDASGWNEADCASIGLISCVPQAFGDARASLQDVIESNSEIKWTSVHGVDKASTALSTLKCISDIARRGYLRVDVIIWNEESRRMGYEGHDEYGVLKDMYSQLLSTVLAYRWPSTESWTHFADQHSGVDWTGIDAETRRRGIRKQMKLDKVSPPRRLWDRLTPIQEVDSSAYRMVQVADLFAGLARFSYVVGKRLNPALPGFRPPENEGWRKPSGGDGYKLRVLEGFLSECSNRMLGVSYEPPTRGLVTRDPTQPVNFWHYEPQHPADKGARRDDSRDY